MNIKDESLYQCLQKTGLRELPDAVTQQDNDKYTYLTAIVLTVRTNGMEAYCVAENDGAGLSVKHDYGPCAAIREIKAVYPVRKLDRSVVPDLRNDAEIKQYLCKSLYSTQEIDALLSTDGKSPEQIKSDRDKIFQYVVKASVDFSNRKKQETERVAEVKSYKSRIKKDVKGKSKGTD